MSSTHRRQLVLLVMIGLLVFAACQPASGPVGPGKNSPELVVAHAVAAAPGEDIRVAVVVAAVDLPMGTLIRDPEKQLVVKAFLADSAPAEGLRLSNIEDLRNKVIGRNISKGEPVLVRDLSFAGQIFRPVAPGHRAMSLALEQAAAVGGFVLPGSRMDVIVAGVKDGKPFSRLLLQNVLVIAVQTSVLIPETMKGKDSKDNTILTFAVKPHDGLRLAEAQAVPGNKITLMLRRPGEEELVAPDEKPPADGGAGAAALTTEVLVARHDIPAGTTIEEPEKLFKTVRYRKGDEPKNAIQRFDQLPRFNQGEGKLLRRALVENEPLTETDLAPAFLKAPPGMRAVTVRVSFLQVNLDGVLGGMLLPGTRVDVICTKEVEGQTRTEVVQEDVLVLASAALGTDGQARNESQPGGVVTLAVKPVDAARIIKSKEQGRLSLVLRQPKEK